MDVTHSRGKSNERQRVELYGNVFNITPVGVVRHISAAERFADMAIPPLHFTVTELTTCWLTIAVVPWKITDSRYSSLTYLAVNLAIFMNRSFKSI